MQQLRRPRWLLAAAARQLSLLAAHRLAAQHARPLQAPLVLVLALALALPAPLLAPVQQAPAAQQQRVPALQTPATQPPLQAATRAALLLAPRKALTHP